MSGDRDSRVSARAYELWEQEGGEHGRHEDHWHRAASEVDEEVAIAAPDGTTLTVPVEEIEGEPPVEDTAGPVRKRAAPKAKTAAPAAGKPSAPKPRKPKAK